MTLAELKAQIAALPNQHPLTDTNVTLVEIRGGNIYIEAGSTEDAEAVKELESRLDEIADICRG